MLQLSSLLELQALRLRYDALRVLSGALCGSATSGLWNILESFFRVEENIKEKRMAEAQSLQHLLKVHKEEHEAEAKRANLSVKKGEEPAGQMPQVIKIGFPRNLLVRW